MLRAKSSEAALGFAYLLKEMIAAAGTRVRIGLSGSSMITFLSVVRVMKPNGFQMFTSNKYVLLGHALTPRWATRIADDLKSAIIEHRPSSLSSLNLTSDMVLDSIRLEKNKLNLRPAIIQQLISKFYSQKSSSESIETKLSKAMEDIVMKMDEETIFDFIHALESLSYSRKFLQTLRLLALGETSGSELMKRMSSADARLLALQCGLNDLDDVAIPVLLPPYAHLCMELLVPNDGNIAVNSALFAGYRAKILAPLFHDVMILCTESLEYFTDSDKKLISDTVVRVLFDHGICAEDADGKKIPVRSVFDHDLLKELHRTRTGSGKYDSELTAYNAWKLAGCHGVPPSTKFLVGLQVQRDLRNFNFHVPQKSESNFLFDGWHINCLDDLAQKLRKCLPETSAPIDFSNPSFPVFKKKV
jgi:hypothetical protein